MRSVIAKVNENGQWFVLGEVFPTFLIPSNTGNELSEIHPYQLVSVHFPYLTHGKR